MATLAEFKALVKTFEAAQKAHARQGAQDTEPDGVFQWLLVRAFKGKKPTVPDDAEGWELYSSMSSSGKAAGALHAAALACVTALDSGTMTLAEARGVEAYLRDYCWRISW